MNAMATKPPMPTHSSSRRIASIEHPRVSSGLIAMNE
jgi:hypothetical protein